MTARRTRYLILGVLVLILAANYMDGLALGLVLQSLKTDLHASDTELGLLTGIAFAFFYSVLGIPIARWADRGNRAHIIAASATVWSVMVALCGFARSLPQLVLLRIGVGIGEAGCVPPAHSLIADYFDRSERPRAVGIYMLGNALSMLSGYFLAGWINELCGWRVMFSGLGVLGLLPAALGWLILRDPRASAPSPPRHADTTAPPAASSLPQVLRCLWLNRTFRHLLYAFSVVYFFGNGIGQWQPAFLIRSYHLKTGELGTWLTVIYGVAGLVGTYAGGFVASRVAAGNERLQLQGMALAYVVYGALCTGIYVAPGVRWAFGCMGAGMLVGSLATAPLFATIQTVIPERMRAMSIAVVYLFANLIGLGLGPLAAGGLSDALRPLWGEESLRYALLALCPGFLWVAWHLWRASQSVAEDIESHSSADRTQLAAVTGGAIGLTAHCDGSRRS